MTITIHDPMIEKQLETLAGQHGQDVDTYAEHLLANGIRASLRLQDFFVRMAAFGANRPILSAEALQRGSFYEGRD
jgi:hypothetical protein